jgi:hypothetical protein
MIADDACSYSALKFWLTTRNSWTAACGKGLPRLLVLPGDAAGDDVGLQTGPVDEGVDGFGALTAGRDW